MTAVTRSRLDRPIRRIVAASVALALVGAGCANRDGDSSEGAVPLDLIEPVAALTPFDSCDALLDHLQAEALDRVGPYGFDEEYPYFPVDDTFFAEADIAEATRGGENGAAAAPSVTTPGAAVSGTNVQEAGVDEPDLVKSNAERMVVLSESRLAVIDLTGEAPEVVGQLDLPGAVEHELLVAGDRALLLSQGYNDRFIDETGEEVARDPIDRESIGGARLIEVDLTDPTTPEITNTLHVEGRYVSARMQGAVARVVVSSAPPDLGFVYPAESSESGEARAEAVNRSVIEESTLENWLPAWSLEGGDADVSGHLADCDGIHRPAEFGGFGLVSVLTVHLGTGLRDPEAVSVLGAGDTVYASTEHLYVATERFVDAPVPDEAEPSEPTATVGEDEALSIAPEPTQVRTAIHRFSAPAEGPVDYEASGEVEGRLLNQFSMSEHEDVLRVATTRGEPWFDGRSDSIVTTLGTEGDRLAELGRVDDLGRGEQIFAVRFVGPVGYVVTFRQTDPLYVVDLRDPSSPTVEGELKILGYSAYLHPIDETHVLGVGQDADEDGRTSGTQVSLFDVADPAAPVRTAQYSVPGGSSEVEWDHRAFLWWEPESAAVLPVEQYVRDGFEDFGSQALVLNVDAAAGSVTERGRGDHQSSPVRRSVVVDDTLVTIDGSGLVFSNLSDLSHQAELPI